MTIVVVTAEVEDSTKWENGFRTHGDLFRKQGVNMIQFTTHSNNEVAIQFDVADADAYMKAMDSQETAAAMSHDGVKRETVKFFVLDKELVP